MAVTDYKIEVIYLCLIVLQVWDKPQDCRWAVDILFNVVHYIIHQLWFWSSKEESEVTEEIAVGLELHASVAKAIVWYDVVTLLFWCFEQTVTLIVAMSDQGTLQA